MTNERFKKRVSLGGEPLKKEESDCSHAKVTAGGFIKLTQCNAMGRTKHKKMKS